jgi:hypothetical protein
MSIATSSLLLKFRQRDTQLGVTRETVKAMAERFDCDVRRGLYALQISL